MEWSLYFSFVAVSLVIAISPGPDTVVVLKNALMSGRHGGVATSLGVVSAATVQAVLAAAGLGFLIAQSQPLLQAIRWIGAAYLAWMAFQALRSAWRGEYAAVTDSEAAARRGFRQGFLVNITNPGMLLFFLAIFPQFMTPDMALWAIALLAVTHPLFGLAQLLAVVVLVHVISRWLQRRPVRRVLDAATGAVLGFLSIRVAADALREA